MSADFDLAATITVGHDDIRALHAAVLAANGAAAPFPDCLLGALVRIPARRIAGGDAEAAGAVVSLSASSSGGSGERCVVGAIVGFADETEGPGGPPWLVVDFASHCDVVRPRHVASAAGLGRAEHAAFAALCARLRFAPAANPASEAATGGGDAGTGSAAAAAVPPGGPPLGAGSGRLLLSTAELLAVRRRLGRGAHARKNNGGGLGQTEEDADADGGGGGSASAALASAAAAVRVAELEAALAQATRDAAQLRALLLARQGEARAAALAGLQDAHRAADAARAAQSDLRAKRDQLGGEVEQLMREKETARVEMAKVRDALTVMHAAAQKLREGRAADRAVLEAVRAKLGLPGDCPNAQILTALHARTLA